MIWPHPTHQPTHQTIHLPMGVGVSTDFKSLNRIEISRLVQVLSNFDWFWGSPHLGVGGGWIGVGVVRGCPPHMCTCTHMHTSSTHIWHHREFPGIPPMGGGHLYEIIMFTTYACVCMHVCVCMCHGGAHQLPPTHIHPAPPPRTAGSPNHQNSINLELIEIIWFCLKILYLWKFLNSYRL